MFWFPFLQNAAIVVLYIRFVMSKRNGSHGHQSPALYFQQPARYQISNPAQLVNVDDLSEVVCGIELSRNRARDFDHGRFQRTGVAGLDAGYRPVLTCLRSTGRAIKGLINKACRGSYLVHRINPS